MPACPCRRARGVACIDASAGPAIASLRDAQAADLGAGGGRAADVFMMQDRAIIGLARWLKTPAGRYLLGWEQGEVDRAVADIFGFHALQLGLPELETLRANRMPHRWIALDATAESSPSLFTPLSSEPSAGNGGALPIDSQSIDLIVMPHTLELAHDAHLALREAERVLRPEGRLVIVGFNPHSLWGARQWLGHLRQRLTRGAPRPLYLPSEGEFIAYRRLRDWLRLLSFEVEGGRFGCYRPPFTSERGLTRFGWMERAGDRWWPVFGAVYFVVAVKRVRGMRLVGLVKQPAAHPIAAPAAVANHREAA